MTENDRQQAVAQPPEQLVHQHRGGVFHEAAEHLSAGMQQGFAVKGNDLAAYRADEADDKLRHTGDQRGDSRALHAQRGEAQLTEDQHEVQPGVQHRGHPEQLHAEGGVFHAALGTDVDGREHIKHVREADQTQIRRAQQGEMVLVAHQIHDLHRPEEQHEGDQQGQPRSEERRHADGAADALQIALAPVLADEYAYAGLYAEHHGDQQEHRHIGGCHRRHLVVAQTADHQRVNKTQRERAQILQGDGRGQPRQIGIKRLVALQGLQHGSPH